MMGRRSFLVNAAVGGIIAASGKDGQQGSTSTVGARQSGYAPVDGLKLYYEIRGSGAPLILTHGGLGSVAMFSAILRGAQEGKIEVLVDFRPLVRHINEG